MDKDTEYSLFLEQVNTLTERRQKVTATYLSVNAAIVGITTVILKDIQMVEWGKYLSVLMLLLIGIFVCDLWRRVIRQYSALVGWWYAQLRNLEDEISENKKLLTKEYQEMYLDATRKPPMGLTRYETRLAWIFTAIYGIFGLIIFISLVFF